MWLRLLSLCLVSSVAYTHFVNVTCPNLKPLENLSIDKILGNWFVVYQLQPSNPCIFWTFSKHTQMHQSDNETDIMNNTISGEMMSDYDTDTMNNTNSGEMMSDHDMNNTLSGEMMSEEESDLVLNEVQLVVLTDSIGVPLRQFVRGEDQHLVMLDPMNPADMIIGRPTSSPDKIDHFVVFDTDYTSYLAIYECDEGHGFLHRRDVTVLAREPTHDPMVLERIQRLLTTAGVPNSLTEINRRIDAECQFESPYLNERGNSSSMLKLQSTDMPEDMMFAAIATAREALDILKEKDEIAKYIKEEFDEKYNTTWNCIVGMDFGSIVTYKRGTYMHFALGPTTVLLFKSPVELPDN